MHRLAFLLKSYAPDAAYAARMVSSFHTFNSDHLPLFIVVPDADRDVFFSLAGVGNHPDVTLIPESELSRHLVDKPVHGLRAGYINQEIVKLAFWELDYAENYFCVDSEAEFLRPFGVDDFMATVTEPYSVLVQDLELKADPIYFAQYWESRERALTRIAELVGLSDSVIRTCHGHTVFSRRVLESFVQDFLSPRGWDYRDALAEAPYEFSWYNLWLQKSQVVGIHPREPWIKVFHTEQEYLNAVLRGITSEDLARAYLGVVVNANFSRELGQVNIDLSKPAVVARALSYGELGSVVSTKVTNTARRILRQSETPRDLR